MRDAVDERDPNDSPDLQAMVAGYLRTHGYSALVADIPCACGLDDLMPCDEPGIGCQAGYEVPCRQEDCMNRDEDGQPAFCEASYPRCADERVFPETCFTRIPPE